MYFGAKNISVSYGKKQILSDITVDFEQGKSTAIIGPNGSGKSTLLKALSRLIKFDGSVIFKDEELAKMSSRQIAQVLALLPQHTQTPEDISIYELVALGRFPYQKLTQQHLSQLDKEIIERVLHETSLWDYRDHRLSDLSGGYQQRAWIAMILVQDSEIILLDEPTTYLDINHQLEIMGLLKSLADQHHKTVIYVIHDLNHVARYADNVVYMKAGKILASGPVSKLFTETMIQKTFALTVTLGQDQITGAKRITGVKDD